MNYGNVRKPEKRTGLSTKERERDEEREERRFRFEEQREDCRLQFQIAQARVQQNLQIMNTMIMFMSGGAMSGMAHTSAANQNSSNHKVGLASLPSPQKGAKNGQDNSSSTESDSDTSNHAAKED